jgi:hypothetical protein
MLDQGVAGPAFLFEFLKSKAPQAEQGSFRGSEKDKPPEEEKNQNESQRGVNSHLVSSPSYKLNA